MKVGFHKYWWSPELDDLKRQCIDMTALWSSLGRPRSGNINAERLRCKNRYKQAIKVAMQENDRAFNHLMMNCMIICVRKMRLASGKLGVNVYVVTV